MRLPYHIAAAVVLGIPALAVSQPLTPLKDPVQEPLLPTGISRGDVELFGSRVVLSEAPDGAEVIHVMGEFELHLARRQYLSAREAVIFLTRNTYRDVPYQHFEVYLWREARVTDSAGTVTSGPVLFVILNNNGKVKAFSKICTHLGCEVEWHAQKKEFFCPCHEGFFNADGKNIKGPPPRPLNEFKVTVKDDNVYVALEEV